MRFWGIVFIAKEERHQFQTKQIKSWAIIVCKQAELGRMASNDKILKALQSAINHLNGSISALKSKDENAFSNSFWHVAAELEYALSLISLTIGNEHNASPIKPNPIPKTLQTDHIVLKVKDLVNEAQKLIKDGDLPNAYNSARLARHYVFEVQESLAKKGRGTSRGKK